MPDPAGKRRYLVSVEQFTGGESGGEPNYADDTQWTIFNRMRRLPVNYVPVSGAEALRGQEMEADTTALIRVPWTPRVAAITGVMRFRLGDRKLNITNVNDDGMKREITFQVSEKAKV